MLVRGVGVGERCCDKFQIFQISINVSPEPLKVLKTIHLVLLTWVDAKEDFEGKTFFTGSLYAGWKILRIIEDVLVIKAGIQGIE